MTRVDGEDRWIFCPGLANRFEWCFPSQSLQVLGEVVGLHERQHMSFQALDVRVVEHLDRGVFDRAVHPFGLAVGPRMIRLGQLVGDAVLGAGAAEDVAA